ncbi:MAG: hypothetical protein R3F48_16245 [Candidatus Zixiibacteriota bacterium]
MKGKIVNVCWMTLFVILFVTSLTLAQVEANTILYQGKLSDNDGAPITTATSITFTFWTALTSGTNLYDTTTSVTPDDNGLFTIELGPFPPSVSNGDKRYLGLTIAGGSEMTPRQLLTSAPTALTALTSTDAPGITYGSAADGNTIYSLADTGLAYASAVLYAPADGYAVITANALAWINHTNGSWDNIIFKVSESANDVSGIGFNKSVVRIPRDYPNCTENIIIPTSITTTVPVSAGLTTFYFNAYESTGTGDDYIYKPIIHVLYVPYYRSLIITKSPEKTEETDNSIMLETENIIPEQNK